MAIKTGIDASPVGMSNENQKNVEKQSLSSIAKTNEGTKEELDLSLASESKGTQNIQSGTDQKKLLDNIMGIYPGDGDIFSLVNDKYGQFGGDQSSLRLNAEEFLKNDKVWEIVRSYFPDVTAEDLELLFHRIESVGCGYVAGINTIFQQDFAKDEKAFEEKFGFPPYTIKTDESTGRTYKDFNDELLLLDFVLYYNVNNNKFTSIEEIYGNVEDEIKAKENGESIDYENITGMTGTLPDDVADMLTRYLAEKDIPCYYDNEIDPYNRVREIIYHPFTLSASQIEQAFQEGKQVVVGAYGFNLYYPYDRDGNGKLDDICYENVGGHAMTVVGVVDAEKIMVSSWGHTYLLSSSTIYGYAIYNYNSVPYLVKNQ